MVRMCRFRVELKEEGKGQRMEETGEKKKILSGF